MITAEIVVGAVEIVAAFILACLMVRHAARGEADGGWRVFMGFRAGYQTKRVTPRPDEAHHG